MSLALVVSAGNAHADYRESYSRGLAALKDGDAAGARKLFEQALAEQPAPALRTRLYGQRWEPYLPQYYLGLAAFQQGDCDAALAQWNSSASRQIVAQLPDINGEQQRAAATCEQKLAASGAAPAKPAATPPAVATVDKAPAAAMPEVKAPAQQPAVPPPQAAVASVERPQTRSEPKAPAEPSAESGRMPPASLIEAFDGFLAGRYKDVGRIEPKSYADARARFHAYVVRAAARYTLAEISGDKDLLETARADARAARALDAKTLPDSALFSPRFRAFFREGS